MNINQDIALAKGPEARQDLPVSGAAHAEEPGEPVIPEVLPILPIRGLVAFPGTVVPLTIRRPSSLKMLEAELPQTKLIGLLTQRDENDETPDITGLYHVGTVATVLKLLRQPDGSSVLIVQGLKRFTLRKVLQTEPYIRAEIEVLDSKEPPADHKEWAATINNLREAAIKLIEVTPDVPDQARVVLMNITDAGQLTDFIAVNLGIEAEQKQALLEELDVAKRVRALQQTIAGKLEIAELQKKLQQDVQSQFTDAQRRAYLREQIKAIQREPGEEGEGVDEQVEDLRKRLQ